MGFKRQLAVASASALCEDRYYSDILQQAPRHQLQRETWVVGSKQRCHPPSTYNQIPPQPSAHSAIRPH